MFNIVKAFIVILLLFNFIVVCCFDPTYFDVKEGGNVEVYVTCSNPLLTSLTIQLEYFDVSADKRKWLIYK